MTEQNQSNLLKSPTDRLSGMNTYIEGNSPPYTFFLLNGDMELYRNRHFFI
jgi:hypothetical protein